MFRNKEMDDDTIINGKCWLAYFDILGFRNQIEGFTELNGEGNLDVFFVEYYSDILRIAKDVVRKAEETYSKVAGKIGVAWFSDTFIFFAPEDTGGSYEFYLSIDKILRDFFRKVLLEGFMFRGAMSFGDFYGNKDEGVFLGPALIDAYDYAEKQDWLGIVLTPKVPEKLKGTRLDVSRRADYANYDVPTKKAYVQDDIVQIKRGRENLYSYRISKYSYVEKKIIEKQKEAKMKNPDDYEVKYKPKYEEVLKFLQTTKLRSVNN